MNGNRLLKTGMGRGLLLRDRAENLARIEPIELFFDLVFVFAITQLSHLLLAHPSPRGAGETLLLLMAVWSAWSFTAWTTSWFDSSTIPVRLLLIAIMVISLFMGAAIPAAFGDDGLEFAIAFVAIQVGRNAWTILALGLGHSLSPSSLRVLIWSIALGALWIGGGLLEGDVRLALWILAVALDYVVTWFGFPIPGRANTRIPVWAISGGHLAERNELFIILALGESILLTGAAFGDLLRSVETVLALIGAFIGSVSLWWLYFDRGAAAGRDAIARSGNPGWLARSAYTYFHLPMVAGIIMTAGADELTIAHPLDTTTPELTVLILGGPALYLIGNALFNWILSGLLPASRLMAIVALLILLFTAGDVSTLSLMFAATLVLLALVGWNMRDRWRFSG